MIPEAGVYFVVKDLGRSAELNDNSLQGRIRRISFYVSKIRIRFTHKCNS